MSQFIRRSKWSKLDFLALLALVSFVLYMLVLPLHTPTTDMQACLEQMRTEEAGETTRRILCKSEN